MRKNLFLEVFYKVKVVFLNFLRAELDNNNGK